MKKFLEKNNIYFTTVAPTLLAIAALFVSIASYQVSKIQSDIEKTNAKPDFFMSEDIKYNEKSNKVIEETVTIKNYGGRVESLDAKLCSVLKLEYKFNNQRVEKLLAIQGYYSVSSKSMNPNDTFIKYYGIKNAEAYDSFYEDIVKYDFGDEFEPVFVTLKQAVKLKYVDVFGDEKVDYFLDGNKNEANDTKKYFNACANIYENKGKIYQLDKLNIKDIIQLMNSENT